MSVSSESSIPAPSIDGFLKRFMPAQDGSSTSTVPRSGLAVPPRLPPPGREPELPCEIEFRIQVLNVIEERGAEQFRELLKRRIEDDAVLGRRRRTLHRRVQARRECENAAFARFSKDVEVERAILQDKQNSLEQELQRATCPLPPHKYIPYRHPFCRTEDDAAPPPGYPSPNSSSAAVELRCSPSPEAPLVVRKQSQEPDDDDVKRLKLEDIPQFEVKEEMPDDVAEEAAIQETTATGNTPAGVPRTIRPRTPALPPVQRTLRAVRPQGPSPSKSKARTRHARVEPRPPVSTIIQCQFPGLPVILPRGPGDDGPWGPSEDRVTPKIPRTQYLRVGGGKISVMLPALDVNISQIYHEAGEKFYQAAHRSIIRAKKGGPKHNGFYVSLNRAIYFSRRLGQHQIVSELEQLRPEHCPADSPQPTDLDGVQKNAFDGSHSHWQVTVLT